MIDIKSKYIIKQIVSNVKKIKLLNLIKNNKGLQEKLEISKSDYESAYKEYAQIEIEIIPTEDENLIKSDIDKYLNETKIKPYLHLFIYKDDKENEERITKLVLKVDSEAESLQGLCDGCISFKEINFIKFNRKNIKDMSKMFNFSINLTNINLSKIKTENVENMNSMFSNCLSLENINVSNFNKSF